MFPPGSFRTLFPSACLPRWPLLAVAFLLLLALAALFAAQPAHAAPGDHVPSLDFDLGSGEPSWDPRRIVWNDPYFYVAGLSSSNQGWAFAYTSTGTYTIGADIRFDNVNDNPRGITRVGTSIYVADWHHIQSLRQIYAYTSAGDRIPGSEWDLVADNAHPQGLTRDETYFYVLDDDEDKAYAYTSSGTHTSSADWNLTTNNADPIGLTRDETYFYVLDRSDHKAYAYTSDGTYTSIADLTLTSQNGDPTGITSAGSYLYVLDSVDNKVYAYSNPNSDPADSDATLSALSLSTGTLSPSFSSSETSYTATVTNNATAVTVSATPTQSAATVTGTGSRALYVGRNFLDVVVTASDGFSTQTYSVDITREGTPNDVAFNAEGVLITPMGTVVASSLSGVDCFLFPSDQQVVVTVFNEEARPLGVCWSASLLYFLFSSGTPNFPSDIASAISYEADLREGSVSSFKRNETNGSLLNVSTVRTATVSGTTYDYSQSDALTLVSGTLSNLAVGDAAHLRLEITGERTVDDFLSASASDIPDAPSELLTRRNAAYDVATVSWSLIGPVIEYQIERNTALPVSADDLARIEYGDTVRFLLAGTLWGVDSYIDGTVAANKTYKYRVRARRGINMWSDWSGYITSGMKPEVDIDPPSNIQLSRSHGNSSITVSWTDPVGEFDNFTLQRQELVAADGSSIFANVVTLDGNNWIDGTTNSYTDSSILPNRTYEYRLASVVDDGVGEYSDWVRSSPISTRLGGAPNNLRYVDDSTSRMLEDRREFRMAWDEMDGVAEYEVEVLVYQVATGEQTMEHYIVSDPSFFRTSYGRSDIRVRGRKADDDLCGSGDDDYCYSDWTGWYGVRFTPKATIEAPVAIDDTVDQDIVDLRESTAEAIEASLSAAGAPVDASLVVQFLTVLMATVIGGISVALGWRLGMAPLGIGMGAAIAILILFTGYRLFGVPLAWPVAIQAALAVAGMFALVRQTGVFR